MHTHARLRYVIAAVSMAVAASGCRESNEGAANLFPTLMVERIQFSNKNPAPFRALAERPLLDGAMAGQQGRLDRWIAGLVAFGNHDEPNVYGVLSTILEKWREQYTKAEREGAEYLHHWYFDTRGRIAFADATYLAYKVRLEEDEGGMHPFLTYRWSVWDFSRKRELTVDDIFKREAMSAVVDLVKSDMAWKQGYTNFTQYSSERCIEDFEELPKNFTIDERGIEFLFNAYEIACGAFGDIRGRLWWESLTSYIRSDFIPPQSATKKGQ